MGSRQRTEGRCSNAVAITRQAIVRAVGKRPFNVQLVLAMFARGRGDGHRRRQDPHRRDGRVHLGWKAGPSTSSPSTTTSQRDAELMGPSTNSAATRSASSHMRRPQGG
jgi:hypothetical protein